MIDIMNATVIKKPNFVVREVAGETLVIPLRNNAVDLQGFFRVNETGAFILGQIDKARTGDDISALVAERFNVTVTMARNDTKVFLNSLLELKFVDGGSNR